MCTVDMLKCRKVHAHHIRETVRGSWRQKRSMQNSLNGPPHMTMVRTVCLVSNLQSCPHVIWLCTRSLVEWQRKGPYSQLQRHNCIIDMLKTGLHVVCRFYHRCCLCQFVCLTHFLNLWYHDIYLCAYWVSEEILSPRKCLVDSCFRVLAGETE